MTTETQAAPKLTMREDIKLSSAIYSEYQSGSYGSEEYYRHMLARDLIYTSGVKVMAEELGAYWFIDIVASYMTGVRNLFRQDDRNSFFVCRISKLEGSKALFTIDDGNDSKIFIAQEIPYTDLYCNLKTFLQTDGERWTLMMPSEY